MPNLHDTMSRLAEPFQLSWKDAELKNSQRNLTNVKKDCEVGSHFRVAFA